MGQRADNDFIELITSADCELFMVGYASLGIGLLICRGLDFAALEIGPKGYLTVHVC